MMTDLGTLGGTSSFATRASGNYIVGDYYAAGSAEYPFVYNLLSHTMTSMGSFGGSTGNLVNGLRGNIASRSANERGLYAPRAFNISTGTYTALPTSSVYGATTVGVNSNHDILGWGTVSPNYTQAIVWKCT